MSARPPATRDALLEAARDLIAEIGFTVTTRAIAERAGVNAALVNYHFGSKNELLLAAFEASVASLGSGFEGPEELAAWLRAAVTAGGTMVTRDMQVLFAATLAAPRNPSVAKTVRAQLEVLRAELQRRAAASGLPHSRAVAIVLAATLDGLLLHRMIDRSTDLASAGQALADLVGPRRDHR